MDANEVVDTLNQEWASEMMVTKKRLSIALVEIDILRERIDELEKKEDK